MSEQRNEVKRIGFMPWYLYVISLAVVLVGIFVVGSLPKGFQGAYIICTIFGVGLMFLGNNIPIVKDYLGGGSIVCLFGAAFMCYTGIFPEKIDTLILSFVNNMDWMGLGIGAMICGGILSMNRATLIKAGTRYFFPVLGGILCACVFAGIGGLVTGFGWRQAILFIAIPIMGGGTSAGAIPIAATYETMMANSSEYYISFLMPAIVLGNAISIVSAGLVNKFGEKYTKFSGNGLLVPDNSLRIEEKRNEGRVDFRTLATGLILSIILYAMGVMIGKYIPSIHAYAWTIILAIVLKLSGKCPEELEQGIGDWFKFVSIWTVPGILFSIGYSMVDIGALLSSLSITYIVLCTLVVAGAIIGAGFIGKLVGLYPVESAITAGLCMSNMGGSGDLAVLSASNRMNLMPFSQISSRIGGGIIIVLSSLLGALIGVGL